MSTDSLFSRFQHKLREFRRTCKGNVALTFGLAAIPIVCAVGAAVDYSHATSVKAALQSALDSTALMLQKETSTDTADQLQTNAGKYFNALFKPMRPEAQNIVVTATYSNENGSHVDISASADVPTNFVGIMSSRFDFLTVRSSATSKWGSTRLRVALALDNTGSMAQSGKMDALKGATKNLLDQLKSAAGKDGDVYVSIVPFNKDVNIGSGNYNENWIDWTDWETANPSYGTCSNTSFNTKSSCLAQGSCSISGKSSQGSCTSAGTCSISGHNSKNSCESDSACSLSKYTSRNKCRDNGGTWASGVWTPTPGVWTSAGYLWTPDHSKWNGCVTDRDESPTAYNVSNTTPTVGPPLEAGFPAEQFNQCPVATLPLTYNWDDLKNKVDAMTPVGNTNTTIGLVQGWQTLTDGNPYNPPAIDTSDGIPTQKVIIFLTDGENTQDRWTSHADDIDTRMQTACTNAKAAGITIFTVLVLEGNESLLQTCASPDDAAPKGPKYFKLTSADQLVTTFNAIGTSLTQLFLAK